MTQGQTTFLVSVMIKHETGADNFVSLCDDSGYHLYICDDKT